MKKASFVVVAVSMWMAAPVVAQVPPVPAPAEDHAMLLHSDDPVLAANKKLVYDMYRTVLQGGQADRAKEFIAEDYIQHNPNVLSGLSALVEFVKSSRPALPVKDTLELPLISMVAERDMVALNFIRPYTGEDGNQYLSTWYDFYRIKDGLIVEHWDPALKTSGALKYNPNTNSQNE